MHVYLFLQRIYESVAHARTDKNNCVAEEPPPPACPFRVFGSSDGLSPPFIESVLLIIVQYTSAA